jgi:zinc protease
MRRHSFLQALSSRLGFGKGTASAVPQLTTRRWASAPEGPRPRLHHACLTAVFTLLFAVAGQFAFGQAATWEQVPIPPLHAFKPKEPKRIVLPNGMILFLQEDHELPLIDGIARIRGGSRSEPANKVGLLSIYGQSWRTGGTKTRTGDQLDDFLEARAAKVETGGGVDATTISFSCLKGDFDDVFKVFLEVMREPEFREEKIDLAKDQINTGIARRNDDPSGIAGRESSKLGYGPENPYARTTEYATVAAVTRQDLLAWHKDHLYPNNMIFGIVGDFDAAALEAKLRQAFASWPKGPASQEPKIDFTSGKPGYYLVDKKDVNQSSIRMVELGTKRDNPDYYALEVLNEAFGGGFSSRLFSSLRTKKGLAYGVGGGVGTAFDHPGLTRLSIATKSKTTIEAIQGLYEEIDALKTRPISADEIKRAKDAILNSFIFNFDSPSKVLRERMAYEFYGYPADFLERYRTGIDKVTESDVARVAAKYLHKDQLAVLVVGNSADFDKPLSSLGTVSNVDITIPGPGEEKGEESANPAASNPEGLALASKVAAAIGGEAKLKSIKALHTSFTLTQKTPQGDLAIPAEATLVYPDRMRAELQTPAGKVAIVVTSTDGFAVVGGSVQDMPDGQSKESREQILRDLVYLAQHANDPSFTFTAAGSEKIGAIDARIVDVGGPGVRVRWFVDPATSRLLRATYEGLGQSGPFKGQTDFADWKTVDGLTLPYTRENSQNGKGSSKAVFTAIQPNPQVDDKLFARPSETPGSK